MRSTNPLICQRDGFLPLLSRKVFLCLLIWGLKLRTLMHSVFFFCLQWNELLPLLEVFLG